MSNCPKCGLLIGHGTMATITPLCQCQWKETAQSGKTHFADDATLEYIRKLEEKVADFDRRCEAGYNKLDILDTRERVTELEAENERLNAEVAMLYSFAETVSNGEWEYGEDIIYAATIVLRKSSSTWLKEHDKQVREECKEACNRASEKWDENPEYGSYGEFEACIMAIDALNEVKK